jgi:hypothetical protein
MARRELIQINPLNSQSKPKNESTIVIVGTWSFSGRRRAEAALLRAAKAEAWRLGFGASPTPFLAFAISPIWEIINIRFYGQL